MINQLLSLGRILLALVVLTIWMSALPLLIVSVQTTLLGVLAIALCILLLAGIEARLSALSLAILFALTMLAGIIPVAETALYLSLILIWTAIVPVDRYWSFAAALRYDDFEARKVPSWPSFLQNRRARLDKIQIYYDPDCGFCKATAHIFREFCIGPHGSVEPSDSNKKAHDLLVKHDSWVLFADDGQTYLEWQAVAYMMRQSPAFWVFGVLTDLKPVRALMKTFYHLIGDNRRTLSRVLRPVLTAKPDMQPRLFHILSGGILSAILLSMIFGIDLFALL